MLNKELLDILICPDNHMPLQLADQKLLDNLNAAIDAGTLRNESGTLLEGKLDEGLVRQDRKILYPILDGIPILLIEEGIRLDGTEN